MKTLFLQLVFACVTFSTLNAQITLEHTYTNASTNLYMVELEISGLKYIKVVREENNRFIYLYNLDHSLWKTIDCNEFPLCYYPDAPNPDVPNYDFSVLYVSENLFDLDNGVEFMFSSGAFICSFTGIYNEDGSEIFYQQDANPGCRPNIPQQQFPIYNTPQGTKMILSFPNTNEAKVYSLAGVLSVNQLGQIPSSDDQFNIFPNPSEGITTIEYKLPHDVNHGQIEIYNLEGKLVKTYQVDNSFQNLVIDNSEIPSGIYMYSLKAKDAILTSKKIIIE